MSHQVNQLSIRTRQIKPTGNRNDYSLALTAGAALKVRASRRVRLKVERTCKVGADFHDSVEPADSNCVEECRFKAV